MQDVIGDSRQWAIPCMALAFPGLSYFWLYKPHFSSYGSVKLRIDSHKTTATMQISVLITVAFLLLSFGGFQLVEAGCTRTAGCCWCNSVGEVIDTPQHRSYCRQFLRGPKYCKYTFLGHPVDKIKINLQIKVRWVLKNSENSLFNGHWNFPFWTRELSNLHLKILTWPRSNQKAHSIIKLSNTKSSFIL